MCGMRTCTGPGQKGSTRYEQFYETMGMPAVSLVLGMAYLITVDNHPGLAARMNIVANVVNLVLDYILLNGGNDGHKEDSGGV